MSLVKEALVKRLLEKGAAPIGAPLMESAWHLGDAAKSLGQAGVEGGKALYGMGHAGWQNPYGRASMIVGGTLGAKHMYDKFKQWEARQAPFRAQHAQPLYQTPGHPEGHYG